MSLAMIALTRCLWITKSLEWNEKYFGGWRGYLIIATIWIYANVLLVPIYLEVNQSIKQTDIITLSLEVWQVWLQLHAGQV